MWREERTALRKEMHCLISAIVIGHRRQPHLHAYDVLAELIQRMQHCPDDAISLPHTRRTTRRLTHTSLRSS